MAVYAVRLVQSLSLKAAPLWFDTVYATVYLEILAAIKFSNMARNRLDLAISTISDRKL